MTLCGNDSTFTVLVSNAVSLLSVFPVGWFHYSVLAVKNSAKRRGGFQRSFPVEVQNQTRITVFLFAFIKYCLSGPVWSVFSHLRAM